MGNMRGDILLMIKEQAEEEKPIDSLTIAGQLGIAQNRIASDLTNLMKKDKFLHRRPSEGKGFVYWYDATKQSQFHRDYKNGLLPKRGAAGREEANKPPARAPIFASQSKLDATLVSDIVFVKMGDRMLFCALKNFKEA